MESINRAFITKEETMRRYQNGCSLVLVRQGVKHSFYNCWGRDE
jgi:hypothetical protein